MTVHELYTALSQCERSAKVTIKEGKLQVGGKPLKLAVEEDEPEGGAS